MRVLFTSVAALGHVHPMVPLATAFRDQGDDVLWATAAAVGPRLERAGIAARPCGLDEPEARPAIRAALADLADESPRQRPELAFARIFGRVLAPAMLEQLEPIVAEWRPDLLVCDAGEFAGPVAAATVGVPHVTHGFGPLLPEARVAKLTGAVEPLWTGRGLAPRPYGGRYDYEYLDICPPAVETAQRGHVRSVQPLRPDSLAADEPTATDGFASSPAPLVYVTFGTLYNDASLLARVVAAVRELPVRVVVTVGPDGDPAALGSQPDSVQVARYLPQAALLPRFAAVVSHAGSGTFLGALVAGLPQLCLPQGADQFLNADGCARTGAGLSLDPDEATPEAIRAALARLLAEPSFRQAAGELSAQIAAMPAPAEVAAGLRDRYRPA